MNWLRLDGFDVGDPRLVHDENGQLTEVQVDCTPNKFDVHLHQPAILMDHAGLASDDAVKA